METKAKVSLIIKQYLTEKLSPYFIILFGSTVGGNVRKDSDIDMWHCIIKILRIGQTNCWFKLLSYNPEDFLKMRIRQVIQSCGLLVERSIRPFTIGRKNWVTMKTDRGAHGSSIIYSIIQTALANDQKFMNIWCIY